MNIAVDREALIEGVVEDFGTPAYTVADHMPWWNPATVIDDGNMEKAKSLLDEAGWKVGAHGTRAKDGLKAAFTLYYSSNDQTRQSLSIALAERTNPLAIHRETTGNS